MEIALIVLALVALVLVGVAGWALASRGRLAAEASAARSDAARAADELTRVEARHADTLAKHEAVGESLRAELRGREAELAGQAQAVARLEEQMGADRKLYAQREQTIREEQTRLQNWIREQEKALGDQFEALSSKTLDASAKRFLELAKQTFEASRQENAAELDKRREAVERLVKPIGETLEKTRIKIEEIESKRVEAFGRLHEQVMSMTGANAELREETARLTKALSRPEIRGQYGEIQLRRVAELAGMTRYCDFTEQASTRDEAGALLRPDMIVTLPNDRVIAVDAKTNTYAYIEAVNARDDEERERQLDRFARHVAEQAKKLGDKKYWAQWEGSPEFVVMFVPGDHFIDAALSRRPDLLETAAEQRVIMASPSTLIGLLRAVAVGWREHALTEQAAELFTLGRELHDRAAVALGHASKLGDSIEQAVKRYNSLVGSLEGRLMPTLRKFEDAGAKSAKALPEPADIEVAVRGVDGVEREEKGV